MLRSRRILGLLLVVAIFIGSPLAGVSQGMPPMPATPVPGEAPIGTLAEFNLRHLPTPHAEVWFLRMELEPGGSLPMGENLGPAILYVESGELSLELDGPVMMPGADRAVDPEELTMVAGDSIQLTRETNAGMSNAGDVPVTFLVLMMFSALDEGEGQQPAEEPVGLAQMGISVGTGEFMDIPATVRIERVVFEPGEILDPEQNAGQMELPGYMGMELGAVESGSAEVTLESAGMANLTWPGMLNGEMSEPVRVPMTATVQLETGDAYAFHGSTLTWAATGEEPLTILRVVITPDPGNMTN